MSDEGYFDDAAEEAEDEAEEGEEGAEETAEDAGEPAEDVEVRLKHGWLFEDPQVSVCYSSTVGRFALVSRIWFAHTCPCRLSLHRLSTAGGNSRDSLGLNFVCV